MVSPDRIGNRTGIGNILASKASGVYRMTEKSINGLDKLHILEGLSSIIAYGFSGKFSNMYFLQSQD